MSSNRPLDPEVAARRALGVRELREGQRPAIEAAVGGRDVLAIMPTGSGKSAIYQVAGALIDGPTVVVSPLVALQHDQMEGLREANAGAAAALNAGTSGRQGILDAFVGGELEFLFVAPEQLAVPETLDAVRRGRPSLVVVDEAHCVSGWGHDFRPDYLLLTDVLDQLSRPPTIALTATASPPVRRHIAQGLGLRDPLVVVTGLDRPNLSLEVRRTPSERDKCAELLDSIPPGERWIVYTTTRRGSEELADLLVGHGRRAAAYHAARPAGTRRTVQDDFSAGRLDVVVATSAFGMGIDVPDVRGVLHWDAPESLDAYYQEIGRAGRDGEPATAVMLFRPEDLARRTALQARGGVSARTVGAVVDALAADRSTTIADLATQLGVHRRTVVKALTRLREVGAVDLEDGERVVVHRLPGAAAAVDEDEQARAAWRETRGAMVRELAETPDCRRRMLLGYFGEQADACGDGCDNCRRGRPGAAGQDDASPALHGFGPGAAVRHPEWGDGEVVRSDGEVIVVSFEQAGYRTLDAALVAERDLLRPAAGDA
ncbi:RecQ family ATP-dependent DNA helicase [Dermatobacter hominis]|uniref:RecQ family ATP-dependent DNA helicase n=1 Tax=Dermatobacter hominis TaxID=2884263 RepID=UPI001D127F6B|nr:RecQ family ATP-dependent DNA helicase [Dermatobacter hominis]UDY37517.1 RecQ family ATP-dependent DNA helicase [Dermatobacter hominis]